MEYKVTITPIVRSQKTKGPESGKWARRGSLVDSGGGGERSPAVASAASVVTVVPGGANLRLPPSTVLSVPKVSKPHKDIVVIEPRPGKSSQVSNNNSS